MKRFTLIGALSLALLGGGLVVAQTTDEHAAHHPATAQKAAPGKAAPKAATSDGMKDGMKGGMMNCPMMGDGMMGGGMMGGGMMGDAHGKAGGMMGGGMNGCGMMCPGMLDAGAKVEVTKQAKGVTIAITSDDAKVIARVQKLAEAMRLMHEARVQ